MRRSLTNSACRPLAAIVFLAVATPVFAQDNVPAARLRALNAAVLQHHDLTRSAGRAQLASVRSQAAADILRREAALSALIRTDPGSALALAFPPEVLTGLKAAFPDSADRFEKRQTWTGVLEATVEDYMDSGASRFARRLNSGGRTLSLYLSGSPQSPASGPVAVTGLEAGGNVAAAGGNVTPLAVAAATAPVIPTGVQKIVAILVTLPSYPLPPTMDAEFIKGILFGNAWSTRGSIPDWNVDDFWQQNSDGQTSAPFSAGKVVGPYPLSSNFNRDASANSFCDYLSLKQAAINAADRDVNFTQFNRIVIVLPNNIACTWSGISGIGPWSATSADGNFDASFSFLRADTFLTRKAGVQLATHELGHGLGLNHARSVEYPGPPRQPLGPIGAAGSLTEYGDNFSTMGLSNTGFYSAAQAQQVLGWLGPSAWREVQTAGQYAIAAYETRGAPSVVKALKVLRDAASNSWLWLEYRTKTGDYDSQLNPQVFSGALIHFSDPADNAYTRLLDFTPATSSLLDPALPVGQTWRDPWSDLGITVNGIAGDTLSVSVTYGAPACAPAKPLVTVAPDNPAVSPGGQVGLTVTVTSNNASTCPVATYSLSATQGAGLTGRLSGTSLSLSPGASGTVTLIETAGAALGTFPVSVTATDTGSSESTATAGSNVTVAALCTAANPGLTLSPGSATLSAGGSATFTVIVTNNNSPGCAAASYNLAAVQPEGFVGTFSGAAVPGLASGARASVTLTEKAGTASGTFALSVTATDAARESLSSTGSATLIVPACTFAAPGVALSSPVASMGIGGSARFAVVVTNNSSPGCPEATLTLAAAQPTGFSGSFSRASLTLAPGGTATLILTETAGAAAGTFTIPITVADSANVRSPGIVTATAYVSTSGIRRRFGP